MFHNVSMEKELRSSMVGFVHTLLLFRALYPGQSHIWKDLCKEVAGVLYSAYNSLEDAKALRHVILQAGNSNADLLKYSFTIDYTFASLDYDQRKVANLPSLHSMISSKAVSKGMAIKFSGSGLNFRHLYISFRREKGMVLGKKRMDLLEFWYKLG